MWESWDGHLLVQDHASHPEQDVFPFLGWRGNFNYLGVQLISKVTIELRFTQINVAAAVIRILRHLLGWRGSWKAKLVIYFAICFYSSVVLKFVSWQQEQDPGYKQLIWPSFAGWGGQAFSWKPTSGGRCPTGRKPRAWSRLCLLTGPGCLRPSQE